MGLFRNTLIGILFIASLVSIRTGYAESVINDGFSSAKKIESRYFNIFIEDGVNIESLAMKLSVPPSIKSIIREPTGFSDSYTLKDQLDTLYLAILEIMDIRLKRFKCNIKICKDRFQLSGVAKKLFYQEMQPGGFYVAQIDTLYIDAEHVNINILGHELSHAIQTHYFVVPPPPKIQEILAGYVEFQLRKYTNTLPR